jgi:hypothetical protein
MSSKWVISLVLVVVASGCATRVIPPAPAAVAERAVVYVTDYGRHSSVVLPVGERWVEYAYGDWDYLALNKYRWYVGPTRLLFSEGSCLGRRYIDKVDNEEALLAVVASERLLRIETDRRAVEDLICALDERFNRHIETLVYNKHQVMYFVRDDSHYWLMNNCNGVTAGWLKELGCRVEGMALLSNFEVVNRKAPTTRPTTRPVEARVAGRP